MYFSTQAPAHAHRYHQLAPARVHFAAAPLPELRLVFDSAYLDTPIATASPKLVALWENRCKSLLDHTQQEQPWSEWVSLMLNEAEDCQPTLDQLAALLSMGPHMLSRHLRREHQSFRELSNRVRYERACRLLRESRIPVSQIAYRLATRMCPHSPTPSAVSAGKVRASIATPIASQPERPCRRP